MTKKLFLPHLSLVALFVFSLGSAHAEDTNYVPKRRMLSQNFQLPTNKKSVKVAFFDADSTLRVSISGSVSANTANDVYLLPCVGERLRQVEAAGYLIAIVSNQGGIPRFVSLKDADLALQKTISLVREAGGNVHWYDFAENEDEYRKPGIGMALELENFLKSKGYRLDKKNSFMVGDSAYKKEKKDKDGKVVQPGDTKPDGSPGTHFSNSDRLFAEKFFKTYAGDTPAYHFEEAAVFFGWRRNNVDVFQAEDKSRSGKVVAEEYLKQKSWPAGSVCPAPDSDLL